MFRYFVIFFLLHQIHCEFFLLKKNCPHNTHKAAMSHSSYSPFVCTNRRENVFLSLLWLLCAFKRIPAIFPKYGPKSFFRLFIDDQREFEQFVYLLFPFLFAMLGLEQFHTYTRVKCAHLMIIVLGMWNTLLIKSQFNITFNRFILFHFI